MTDFGLAKVVTDSMHTQEGAILGSPRYMSPEQAAGKPAGTRADAYSLGITLYQMVTGRVPFEGDTASLLAQHITQTPAPPRSLAPELPAELEELLLGMLTYEEFKALVEKIGERNLLTFPFYDFSLYLCDILLGTP